MNQTNGVKLQEYKKFIRRELIRIIWIFRFKMRRVSKKLGRVTLRIPN